MWFSFESKALLYSSFLARAFRLNNFPLHNMYRLKALILNFNLKMIELRRKMK